MHLITGIYAGTEDRLHILCCYEAMNGKLESKMRRSGKRFLAIICPDFRLLGGTLTFARLAGFPKIEFGVVCLQSCVVAKALK